jgi:hypothetical protein
MRKRIKRAVALVTILVVFVAIAVATYPRGAGLPGVTQKNVMAIRVGMSVDDVEQLMGRPPVLFDLTGPIDSEDVPPVEAVDLKHWIDSNAAASVWFDKDGKVVSREVWGQNRMASRSLLERLWSWLGF